MRIALIDPSLFSPPYDAALAAGLQSEGHEVVLHGRRPGPEDGKLDDAPLAQTFYRVAASPLITSMPKPVRQAVKGLDHIVSMAALERRLTRERPDVIHFQWLPLPLVDRRFMVRLRRIAPLVLTVHDSNPFNGNPPALAARWGTAASYVGFDRVIVHTEQGRARLLGHGVPEDRLALMPHGLLSGDARKEPVGAAPEEPVTFLLFGKIKPYKGLDLLVEAFARLPADLASLARLRVVGKPYMDLAPIETRISQLGLAGRVTIEPRFIQDEEIPLLFGQRTIVVFPYREIEASGVLSLAIAYGRPILASRLGGFAETVTDGVHGILVQPGDVAELAAAMARFIADPGFTTACASEARNLAGAIPTWSEIARRTVEVYRSIGCTQRH